MNWNKLFNIPVEAWGLLGISIKAVRANADGMVDSFIAIHNRQRVYGYRRYRQGHPSFKDPYFEIIPT